MKDEDQAEKPIKECEFEGTDACDKCTIPCPNHPLGEDDKK